MRLFKRLDTLEVWQLIGLIDLCRRELVRLVEMGMDPEHECALFWVEQLTALEEEAARRGMLVQEDIPEV